MATFTLPPIIARLRQTHPGIEIELLATNEKSDLSRREADIAIRSFRPTEPALIAKKIGDTSARLYASPAYLEQLGNPTTPEALSRGQFLGFDRGDALMKGLNALGLSLTAENFAVITQDQLVQWELTKQGVGISIMTDDVGDREPGVRRALPAFPPVSIPMWLTTHRELSTSRRMRVVFDFLFESLAA